MSRFIFVLFFLVVSFVSVVSPGTPSAADTNTQNENDAVTKVICNVIVFVQRLGLPIMTGVILGSSIMAIFGRLPWPAIVMLVVFTAIFFGAGKLIGKFANGVSGLSTVNGVTADKFDCATIAK